MHVKTTAPAASTVRSRSRDLIGLRLNNLIRTFFFYHQFKLSPSWHRFIGVNMKQEDGVSLAFLPDDSYCLFLMIFIHKTVDFLFIYLFCHSDFLIIILTNSVSGGLWTELNNPSTLPTLSEVCFTFVASDGWYKNKKPWTTFFHSSYLSRKYNNHFCGHRSKHVSSETIQRQRERKPNVTNTQ